MQWPDPDEDLKTAIHKALVALQSAEGYVWVGRLEDARRQLDEAERVIREFRQR